MSKELMQRNMQALFFWALVLSACALLGGPKAVGIALAVWAFIQVVA